MAQTTVSGSTVIKFIRQGDTINTMLLATKPLIQYVKEDPVVVTPDWTIAANRPVIYPRITSQLSDTIITSISEVKWFYDDRELVFSNNVTADNNFKKTTYQLNGADIPALQITGNIMQSVTAGKTIKFSGKITTGGISTQISATIQVTRAEVTGEVYTGYISATNGGVVSQDSQSTLLTAMLLKGGNEVTSGISYKWYRLDPDATGGWLSINKTTKAVTIRVEDVDTQETFKCEMSINGNIVANAFFDVRDESDPLYILLNPSHAVEELSFYQQSLSYSPKVRRRGSATDETGWAFSYILLNSGGSSLRTGNGTTFTVTYQEIEKVGGDLTLDITAKK